MGSLIRHSSWQNMLCWGLTAVSFGCCILVLLSLLSSLTQKLLHVLWSADWLWYLKNIRFLCLQKLLGCFSNVFRIIIHLHCKTLSSQVCKTSEFRHHIISKHQFPSCHNTDSPMSGRWCGTVWIMLSFFPSQQFSPHILMLQTQAFQYILQFGSNLVFLFLLLVFLLDTLLIPSKGNSFSVFDPSPTNNLPSIKDRWAATEGSD